MLRRIFWALALVASLSLLVPACGSDEVCINGTYQCFGLEARVCQSEEWHPLFDCTGNLHCCMMNGYPVCALNCVY